MSAKCQKRTLMIRVASPEQSFGSGKLQQVISVIP